jgi:muramidase (phage lysozyme)
MSKTYLFLKESLKNANVKAFLKMIRKSEGTDYPNGYRYLFGSSPNKEILIDDYSDHPNKMFPYTNKANKVIKTSATGAYQILGSVWKSIKDKYELTDFSPENQDIAALELLSQKNCVQKLIDGKFLEVLDKAKSIWASLPNSNVDQPTHTLEKVKKWYEDAGGKIN